MKPQTRVRGRGRLIPKKSFVPPPTPLDSRQYGGGRRDSDASFTSSRPSSIGVGRSSAADLVSDRSNQQSAVRSINAYLSDHSFPFLIKSGIPSAKDITAVVNFVISQLDFANPKMEDDLPILLRSFKCPFKISKSALRAPATPHAWPAFVAVLHWLVQIAMYGEDLASADSSFAFENPIHAYARDSYLHFLVGDDESVEALDKEFLKKLEQEKDAIVEQVKALERQADELQKQSTDEQMARGSHKENLEKKRSVLEGDIQKFNTVVEHMYQQISLLEKVLEEKEKELKAKVDEKQRICEQNEELKKAVLSQNFNARDAERMKKEMQAVEREIAEAGTERNSFEEKCWDLDLKIRSKFKELTELADDCNKTIRKLKLVGDIQYKLNPYGNTPAEVIGFDDKLTIVPALDSLSVETNKGSVAKSEEKKALQQQSKENSMRIDEKRTRITNLRSRVEQLEARLVSLKKETHEYVYRCSLEAKRMTDEIQTEAYNMLVLEKEASEILKASELKLQDAIRESDEETQGCASELFVLVNSVSEYKEYIESLITKMKTALSDTVRSISEAHKASLSAALARTSSSSK